MYMYLICIFFIFYIKIYAKTINIQEISQSENLINKSSYNYRNQRFSGYYVPNYDSTERYGAAWLTQVETFMNPKYIERLKTIRNLEAVSLALVRYGGVAMMTRDYFDFQG